MDTNVFDPNSVCVHMEEQSRSQISLTIAEFEISHVIHYMYVLSLKLLDIHSVG